MTVVESKQSQSNDERFPEVKPTKPGSDTPYIAPIIGKLGYDTDRPWLFGLGTSPNNGVDFHVFLSFDGLNFDDNDIDKIWNGGTADKVKKEVDSATAEIPAAVSAASSAVSAAESAVAASKVNSDAIVAQSEAISEAKSAMDSATAEIQQTAANAASDAAEIRADVARVQNEVDTAKTANSASVEALKSDIDTAKQDLANVHDSLTKAQSAIEQNQKLINDNVAKITSDVSATKQDLATVHDSLTKAQAAAEQNQKAINDSIAEINANVDATNQDLAGVRKDLTKAQSDIIANQKAVNDNVAQINSDIAQDRKDIASAQQANADTAKQLDTYSKQATEQGKTIKTIQDKQDGFTATLADVQGNVSQVSDKVDGLSANLKDAQDNVASVKAQADQLSATLTDHAKSIATLTASAKELSSTLEDADGRLSKVEQTAQTNSSTLADMQGDLSQVKQDTTTLTATLKDAQGNISTLQQKADSVSAQLASAQGDIATLQTGVAGVKATLASHDKSIHTLQLDSKSLKDSMADAQGDISALSKTATSLDSEMKDHAGRLSKVEQSAATQATTLSDLQGNLSQVKQQADGLVTTLKDAQGDITQIQQKADGTLAQLKSAQGDIASLQTNITGIKATLVSHEGDIHTLQADSRMLKDDMQDAQGDISTLKKTSTDVTAELQDHAGRISKTEQTASTLVNELADQQGHLNRVEQTAQGTQQTVANQQGQINTIKTDAAGMHQTITGQGNQIANINVTLSGLNTKYEGVSGDLNNLKSQAQWATVTSAVDLNNVKTPCHKFLKGTLTNAPNEVAWWYLTVEGSEGNRVTQTVIADQSNNRYTRRYADSWSAWVRDATQTDVTALSNRITTNSTQITQNKKEIDLKADQSTMDSLSGEVSQNKAQLTVQAGQISSKVSGIETSLADANSKINDITSNGGGRNLLRNSTNNGKGFQPNRSKIDNYTVYTTASVYMEQGQQYTVHADASNGLVWSSTHDPSVESNSVVLWLTDSQTVWQIISDSNTATGTTFTWNHPSGTYYLRVNTYKSDNSGYVERAMLEKGVVAHDWQPAPEDTDAKITANSTQIDQTNKQISLKADQTEVDQVKQTATQNSSRLDVMADQIKSKVTSTDVNNIVDGKGYATTSTVQSLITQKAGTINESITSLDAKYNATVTQVQSLTASIDGLQSTVANKADKSQITQLSNVIQSKVSTSDFNNLRKAVDLQTLESADANNLKTNGHYFVHNLANNPVGGWVYVDVTGNGADRIRQDVYQDNGNQHKYRRWFGDSWTAWSQGATESEITQLRDDINLRVKSGDLLSQINLTAHNTLIQSNKIYLDSSSTVFSGKAFIPSAAIVNLDVAKLNAGTINTDRIHIGDDSVYLSVKNNYLRLDGSNTKDKYQLRLTGNDIEFADNDSSNWEYRIQHGITKYQTDEDGLDFDVYSKHLGANHTVMAVSDAGVMISPSLFFQTDGIDSSNWMGFTRNTVDGNSSVSFHTWNDENEGFHVDCGARFLNYVYINGYARAQGWLTNSTLSKKTNIRKLDNQIALDKIRQDDQYLYEYKRNVAKGIYDPQASFIIDDVNDVAQYSVPREFIDQTGNYREPNVELAYLVAAFQALDKQVQEQNETIKKLEAKLNE